MVVAVIGIIIYTFRDSARPIFNQLKQTAPLTVIGICLMAAAYQVIEVWITTVLAKQYEPSFTGKMGVTNAFFCSFYRVATLGSGAGVAAIFYLNEHGVEYSKGFGLYMLQYAFHKISIALFSVIFFVCNWSFMWEHYSGYAGLLAAGYFITLLITLCLILFCCSTRFHKIIFALLDFANDRFRGKFNSAIFELHGQCDMMENASKYLLKKRRTVLLIILMNLLKFCFWYGIPYLVLRETGSISLAQVMAITSLSVMLAAVIPSPAGIGSTEFVLIALFSGITGTGLAGSASLLYRFGTFVFPFLVGGVIVLARHFRAKRVAFVQK